MHICHMSAGNAPKFVFINPSSGKNAASHRERELQRAQARSHAARVSHRRLNSGIAKHGIRRNPTSRLPASFAVPSVLALRPVLGDLTRRSRVPNEVEEDQGVLLDRRIFYSPSTSSLGQGQVDPFDTAPIQGLDNFIYSILDFAYDYAFPSFVPAAPVTALPTHRANRRKLGRQYGYLLEAQIAAAARFQMSPMISTTEDTQKQFEVVSQVHEKAAIELLNQEVRRLTTVPPDTLIYAAALLAYVSGPNYSPTAGKHPKTPLATTQNLHAMGHLEIVPERVQAVRTLVQLRGGIDELTLPYQRIVLTYLDTIVSTRLGVRPGWKWPAAIAESLQRTGEHILDQIAVELMQTLGSGFNGLQHEEMRQALLLMCEVTVALDHCHRGGSTAPSIWDVARVRVAVQHRLCSFDPISPDQTKSTEIQFELCRLSALIYSDMVLFPIPEHSSVKPPLLDDLGRILDKYRLDGLSLSGELAYERSSADSDLLAWCVLLATAASTSSRVFRPQYLKRLEQLIRLDQRLQHWEFYKNLVRRFLWWGYVLDPLAWEAFTALPWQDIANRNHGLPSLVVLNQAPGAQRPSSQITPGSAAAVGDDLGATSKTCAEGEHNLRTDENAPRNDLASVPHLSASQPDAAQAGGDAAGTASMVIDPKQEHSHGQAESEHYASGDVGSPYSLGSGGDSLQEFQDADLLQWVNVFFERLYSTLPIVDRLAMYKGLMLGRHKSDLEFASLTLALCSLALVQPVFKAECGSMPLRTERAVRMLSIAIKMRSISFGENMTFDGTVTSFLLFAAFFGLGFQKAAWLRLREAVECGRFIALHQAETYQDLGTEEKARRFRLFLLLSVTEREYALQWNYSIRFKGQNMVKMEEVYRQIEASSSAGSSNILVHDERDLCAMRALLQLMNLFDSVDEEVIPCWNKTCCSASERCSKFTVDRARKVYDAVTNAMTSLVDDPGESPLGIGRSPQPQIHRVYKSLLNDLQWAYCFVLQQWLLVRLWVSCLTHDLLDDSSELAFLRPSFSMTIAECVLEECQQLGQAVLEVHGVGMIERLHDIAMGLVMAAKLYVHPGTGRSMDRIDFILGRYFELLGRLRNGESRFMSALRKAYELVQ
ncbi:hypothetical protein PV04_08096 [Phialophora macrospora]|uniref:Transcription factor domain-containing protein n=1 Tax=Phialophora macrospora TaxID=1851006 RepID=A0A0D2FGI9_9EURO|nr:hypothetical protein PV04_08096 [Phialophora macrospora]